MHLRIGETGALRLFCICVAWILEVIDNGWMALLTVVGDGFRAHRTNELARTSGAGALNSAVLYFDGSQLPFLQAVYPSLAFLPVHLSARLADVMQFVHCPGAARWHAEPISCCVSKSLPEPLRGEAT